MLSIKKNYITIFAVLGIFFFVAGSMQGRFGESILGNVQADFLTTREVLERELIRETQVDIASGVMASALSSTLMGKETAPISQEVFDVIKENGGYRQISNFALAVTMLESDTGMNLSHLLPSETSASGVAAASQSGGGLGGFAEFGFFAISGFLFMMYAVGAVLQNDRPPMEDESEEVWAFPKAA